MVTEKLLKSRSFTGRLMMKHSVQTLTSVRSRVFFTVLVVLVIVSSLLVTGCGLSSKSVRSLPAKGLARGLEIHMIDVGYGESILLVSPDRHFILWDAGYPEQGRKVADYCAARGVTELDLVVSSHPHPDHIGGLGHIIDTFPVKQVWASHPLEAADIPPEFRRSIQNNSVPYHVVRRGIRHMWRSDIELEILSPIDLVADLNDSSLVCQIRYGHLVILLTADIGPRVQQELVERYGDRLQSCWTNVSHHGGISFLPFYDAVNPKFMALSVGENPWGNPKTQTIEYLKNRKGRLLRTDQSGTLVFSGLADGTLEYIP